MEEIKETQEPEKVYSREELDSSIASAKKRWEAKLEKNYVSIEKFNEISEQLAQANAELKLPKVKEQFITAGGKEEAFNDFVKLNSNVIDLDNKELSKLLESSKKAQSYMFKPQNFNATIGTQPVQTKNDLGLNLNNGSLLRTK